MKISVNIGLQKGVFANSTKPLPESVMTCPQMCFSLRAVSWEKLIDLIINMWSEIVCVKLLPHLPGTNELLS